VQRLKKFSTGRTVRLMFQDEAGFGRINKPKQAQASITRTWAPKGSEPKVMLKPGKNNIAYSGFVIPD